MRCTPEFFQEAEAFLAQSEGEALARIQAASVRITAPNLAAGAVLCKLDQDAFLNERCLLVTSKRILAAFASPESELPEFHEFEMKSLLRKCVGSLKIHYGQDQEANVDQLATFEWNWSHDLLVLLSRDLDLRAYCHQNGMFASPGKIRAHRLFFTGVREELALLQTGTDDIKAFHTPHQLIYRVVQPVSEEDATGYHVSSCELNTTEASDLGFGLFAVHSEKKQPADVFLKGINSFGPNKNIPNRVSLTRELIERTYTALDLD